MSVLDKLVSALNRRDEVPNQEPARSIVRQRNAAAVRERFQQVMEKRLRKLDRESQKKRIAKVLKKLTK